VARRSGELAWNKIGTLRFSCCRVVASSTLRRATVAGTSASWAQTKLWPRGVGGRSEEKKTLPPGPMCRVRGANDGDPQPGEHHGGTAVSSLEIRHARGRKTTASSREPTRTPRWKVRRTASIEKRLKAPFPVGGGDKAFIRSSSAATRRASDSRVSMAKLSSSLLAQRRGE
jgi:hypothetical protein